MQIVVCMKWGSRYGPEYVNRLNKSIKKHTKRKTKLYCFTDNTANIDRNIICKPLPKIYLPENISNTPWRKMSLWQYPLYDLKGDVLFLDLDLVITGNLDRFFDYKPGNYCVIENWTQIGKNILILVVLDFLLVNTLKFMIILKKIQKNTGRNSISNKFI